MHSLVSNVILVVHSSSGPPMTIVIWDNNSRLIRNFFYQLCFGQSFYIDQIIKNRFGFDSTRHQLFRYLSSQLADFILSALIRALRMMSNSPWRLSTTPRFALVPAASVWPWTYRCFWSGASQNVAEQRNLESHPLSRSRRTCRFGTSYGQACALSYWLATLFILLRKRAYPSAFDAPQANQS